MVFVLPTFNLNCRIFTNTGNFSTKVFRLSSICQLRGPQQGPRVGLPHSGASLSDGIVPLLLLPPLTDIRDRVNYGTAYGDLVEVPSLSGRWYQCYSVDDIGKGFANEHRYATLSKAQATDTVTINCPTWPSPIP